MSDELVGSALIWLATYLVHSSVLLGGVWLFLAARRGAGDGLRESLWRGALLGGLLTASTQWALGFDTFTGNIQMSWLATAPTVDSVPQSSGPTVPHAAQPELLADASSTVVTEIAAPLQSTPAVQTPLADWRWRFGLAMVIVALFSAPATVLNWMRLNRLLGARVPVCDEALMTTFERLCRTARLRRDVRLTHSKSILSPVAFGVWRREICLPHRVLTELTQVQQQSMLAHELAHHVRRDPFWLSVSRLMVSVFFFQPLNRIAVRRLQEIAEFRCDAWAIERTGDDLPLAQCLASVASWMVRPNKSLVGQPVAAMAANESVLRRRIARIVEEQSPERHNRGPALAMVVATLLVAASVAPALTIGTTQQQPDQEAIDQSPDLREDAAASTGEAIELIALQVDALSNELTSLRAVLNGAPPEATASLRERMDTLDGALEALHEHVNLLRNLWLMSTETAAPETPPPSDAHHRLTDRSIR